MTHALRDSETLSNDRVAQNREIIIDFPREVHYGWIIVGRLHLPASFSFVHIFV